MAELAAFAKPHNRDAKLPEESMVTAAKAASKPRFTSWPSGQWNILNSRQPVTTMLLNEALS